MAAKRKSAKREAGQRKLSLLAGLARLEEGPCRSPAVTELEDSDPYKFVGSQSMEVVDKPSKKTPRVPSTASVHQKPKKKVDSPRQPLTETERLELQEAEDLKRAIEASLQDVKKKRGEPSRKRKRGAGLEQSKQEAKFDSVQRRIKRTKELVEAAQNLGGETTLPTSKKANRASPGSDAVCEDPPSSFFESPPPPATLPEEASSVESVMADVYNNCHGNAEKLISRKQATPIVTTASSCSTPDYLEEIRNKPIPHSQLKSVTITKLNLTKNSSASTETSTSAATAETTTSSAASTSAAEQGVKNLDLAQQGVSDSSVQQRRVNRRKKVDRRSGKPLESSEQGTKDSHVTPVGVRSNSPVLVQHIVAVTPTPSQGANGKVLRLPATDGSRTSCLTDADTPPLPSVHSRLRLPPTTAATVGSTTLPASDCREAERYLGQPRPPRRKLSLSFKKKPGSHRQVIEVSKKSAAHDETIEIDSRMVDSPPAMKKSSKISGEKTSVEESLLSPSSSTSSKKNKPVRRKIDELSPSALTLTDNSPHSVKNSHASSDAGRDVSSRLPISTETQTPFGAKVADDSTAANDLVVVVSGSERLVRMAEESGVTVAGTGPDSEYTCIDLSNEAAVDMHMEATEEDSPGHESKPTSILTSPYGSTKREIEQKKEHHSKRPKHATSSTKKKSTTTAATTTHLSKQSASQVTVVTTPKRPVVQAPASQLPKASTTHRKSNTVKHSATQIKESPTPQDSRPRANPSATTPQAPKASNAPKGSHPRTRPPPVSTQTLKESNTLKGSHPRASPSPATTQASKAPKGSHPLARPTQALKESITLKGSHPRNPSPPVRYAVEGTPPAQYSKVILSSFDSYFSQLMRAQSQVLWRVPWGEPIKCGARQLGRKTRAACRSDNNFKFALKLGKKTRKQPDSDFSLNTSVTPTTKPLSRLPSGGESGMECGRVDDGVERGAVGDDNECDEVGDNGRDDSRSCKDNPPETDESSDVDIESADIGEEPVSSMPPQLLPTDPEWEVPMASGSSSGGANSAGMDGIEGEGVEEEAGLEESCFDDIMDSIGEAGAEELEPSPIVINTQDDVPPQNKTDPVGPNDPITLPDSVFPADTDSQIINRILSDNTPSPDPQPRNKPGPSQHDSAHSTQSTRTPSPIPAAQTSRSKPVEPHSLIFRETLSSSSPSPGKSPTVRPASSLHVISSPSPSPSPPTSPTAYPAVSPQHVIPNHSSSPSPTRIPVAEPAEKAASPWLSSRRPPPLSTSNKKNRKRSTPSRIKASKPAKKAKVPAGKKAKSKRNIKSAAARLMQSRASVSSSESADEADVAPSRNEALCDPDSGSSDGEGDTVSDTVTGGGGGHGGALTRNVSTVGAKGESSRAASTRGAAGVIDLTDKAESSEDDSWPQFTCPLCNQMFDEGEIEAHAAQCMGVETEEGKLQCPKCSKLFEGSLINFHVEQCGGRGGESSDDEFTIRRRPIATAVSARGKRKKKSGEGSRGITSSKGKGASKQQLTLSRFAETARSSSPDIQIDDIVEISDPRNPTKSTTGITKKTSLATTTSNRRTAAQGRALSRVSSGATPHIPESSVGGAHGSEQQPLAIRCEDGGYMVDPSTISNSPIRTYTPLNALAPRERDSYQNQFQKTGKNRDSYGNQLRITGQSRNYQNDFDTLLDDEGNGGGERGSGWNTKRPKRGGPAKQYKNWKPNWKNSNKKYYKKKK